MLKLRQNCDRTIKLEAPANYASASVSRSAPLGARTLDTLIKSQVLYQLS